MPAATPPAVFISAASTDFALAEEVYRRLKAAELGVWFDKAPYRPGCDWHQKIEAECEPTRRVLPVLTPRWKLAAWTKFKSQCPRWSSWRCQSSPSDVLGGSPSPPS